MNNIQHTLYIFSWAKGVQQLVDAEGMGWAIFWEINKIEWWDSEWLERDSKPWQQTPG